MKVTIKYSKLDKEGNDILLNSFEMYSKFNRVIDFTNDIDEIETLNILANMPTETEIIFFYNENQGELGIWVNDFLDNSNLAFKDVFKIILNSKG